MSLKRAVGDLKSEIASHSAAISMHQGEIRKLKAALAALGTRTAGTKKSRKKVKKIGKRKMTAAVRKKMSLAAKKRWAKKKRKKTA